MNGYTLNDPSSQALDNASANAVVLKVEPKILLSDSPSSRKQFALVAVEVFVALCTAILPATADSFQVWKVNPPPAELAAESTHMQRGFELLSRKYPEEAAAEFDHCTHLADLSDKALQRMANCYMECGQFLKAVKDSTIIINRTPKSAETASILSSAYDARSNSYRALRKLDESVADCLIEVQLDPKRTAGLLSRAGQVRREQKRYDEALKYMDQVAAFEKKYDPWRMHDKVLCLNMAGRYTEAEKICTEALNYVLQPKLRNSNTQLIWWLYSDRIKCYEMQGKKDLATADKKALNRLSNGLEQELLGSDREAKF